MNLYTKIIKNIRIYNTMCQKILSLLNKNNLVIFKVNHINQSFSNNAIVLIYTFLYQFKNKRRFLEIDNNITNLIIDIEEAAIYYENSET